MTGQQFLDALAQAVAPRTIASTYGAADGVTLTLSDGQTITAKRKLIAKAKDDAELSAYIAGLLNG